MPADQFVGHITFLHRVVVFNTLATPESSCLPPRATNPMINSWSVCCSPKFRVIRIEPRAEGFNSEEE